MTFKPLIALALVYGLITAPTVAEPQCHQGPTVNAVTARREAFNQAIQLGDASAIQDLLAENVVLVTGTGSTLLSGKAAQIQVWRDDFANEDERFVYRRTPACIRLSAVGPMASERGSWLGRHASGDTVSGSYSAKWRRIDGQWRLEAEIFMTEACTGAGCA